jgi:DNA-binding transcriptional regulator YiaG
MNTSQALRAKIASLGLTQSGAARLLGVEPRTMRRWLSDAIEVPGPARKLLALLDIPEVRARLDQDAD